MPTPNYNTLEDIELRKDELRVQLQGKSEKIGGLWRDLFLPKTANTKGELIADEDIQLVVSEKKEITHLRKSFYQILS